jgi:hypothetical protein
LFAGYKGRQLGIIGHHQVVSRQTKQEGADTFVVFQTQVLPGIDRSRNIDWYCPVGGDILENIIQLCDKFSIEVRYSGEKVEAKKEYSNSGTFVQIMDDLCDKLNAKWLFAPTNDQKNPRRIAEIYNVDTDGFCLPFSTNQINISHETGLTKFPTSDVKLIYDGNFPVTEYRGEMLLNPFVKVGTRLFIEDAEGKKPAIDMYVSHVKHSGSLYGDVWHTTFSGRSTNRRRIDNERSF